MNGANLFKKSVSKQSLAPSVGSKSLKSADGESMKQASQISQSAASSANEDQLSQKSRISDEQARSTEKRSPSSNSTNPETGPTKDGQVKHVINTGKELHMVLGRGLPDFKLDLVDKYRKPSPKLNEYQ